MHSDNSPRVATVNTRGAALGVGCARPVSAAALSAFRRKGGAAVSKRFAARRAPVRTQQKLLTTPFLKDFRLDDGTVKTFRGQVVRVWQNAAGSKYADVVYDDGDTATVCMHTAWRYIEKSAGASTPRPFRNVANPTEALATVEPAAPALVNHDRLVDHAAVAPSASHDDPQEVLAHVTDAGNLAVTAPASPRSGMGVVCGEPKPAPSERAAHDTSYADADSARSQHGRGWTFWRTLPQPKPCTRSRHSSRASCRRMRPKHA